MDGARKLLVTGARGFVAGSVIAAALNEHEIHAVSRGNPILCHPNLKWYTLDLLDTSSVAELFKQTDPHAVVHTAALANIDVCEKDPALARRINVEMTALVAEMSAKHGARLVYCSTDNVFDGRHAPYTENDEPCPVNVYGQTKSEAERLVMNVSRGAVVARLAFVVGLPLFGNGESFLTRVIRAIVSGEKLCAPHDEYRTPIDVVTAGRALVELALSEHSGIFHLAGNQRLNRVELLREISDVLGLPMPNMETSKSPVVTSRAPRPKDVSLDNSKARRTLKTPMLSFTDGLLLAMRSCLHPTRITS